MNQTTREDSGVRKRTRFFHRGKTRPLFPRTPIYPLLCSLEDAPRNSAPTWDGELRKT
jgi:hypothetical protein